MIRARAPGRVNLIGEHTDYNDGFVMPAAIGYATQADATPRDDRRVEIASAAFDEPLVFDLEALPQGRRNDWGDYARGILIELGRCGVTLRGANVHVSSTIPLGAGLSSSASFEVALALAMLAVSGATLGQVEIARLAQRAENDSVGARSGIMDQFAVLFGEAGNATFLDTRSLEFAHLPVPPQARIVIGNTMVKHALAGGEYNARRAQCEEAVEVLQRWYPEIRALRDVTLADLEAHHNDLSPTVFRRARHVVTENARVRDAAAALEAGDVGAFGALMNASHDSLRDDYEVSCPELDAMVYAARECDGVFGARMTGGGFGGCTVNLVEANAVPEFRRRVAEGYRAATGIDAALYDGTPVDGASVDE
jgi:galactokinase